MVSLLKCLFAVRGGWELHEGVMKRREVVSCRFKALVIQGANGPKFFPLAAQPKIC